MQRVAKKSEDIRTIMLVGGLVVVGPVPVKTQSFNTRFACPVLQRPAVVCFQRIQKYVKMGHQLNLW